MSDAANSRAWLIPLPGKIPLEAIELSGDAARAKSIVLGRSKDCDICLPIEAEEVSRCHAEFVLRAGQWGIADLASRWGTVVNGVKVAAHRLVPLAEGDLIGVHPWTFRFSTRGPAAAGSVAFEEDSNATMVRTLSADRAEPLRQDMLNLLLEASSALQGAADESALATVLTEMARRGTGLPNAALLRALDAEGNVDPIATRIGAARKSPAPIRYSRSLLAAAATGSVAEFAGGSDANIAQSIIQSNVQAAICAPLMLGATVAAFLYVDSRGNAGTGGGQGLRPNAAGFCQTLARMGALALANLKRLEVERRAAHLESELKAAAVAQRWILPRESVQAGPFTCAGQTRSGDYLGGDFFDVQVLGDGRLSVALGDVSGHGAGASVLMTAAQGFLHASLANHGELGRAMAGLNTFVEPRRPTDKFITLWIGVFDAKQMTLQYVDAGHGYALLLNTDGQLQRLNEDGGPPVGLVEGFDYTVSTISLGAGQRVLVISDGIAEQFGAQVHADGKRRQFELEGVASAVHAGQSEGLVDRIFESLYRFAGCRNLSDDATAVLVNWS
jgi:serine phosphatase RsbU (regulator of sigma subunit)